MKVGELLAKLKLDSSGYQAGIEKAEKSNIKFGKSLFSLSNLVKSALAGFGAKKLTDFFIGGNASFEQYEITFTKLFDSAEMARAKMEELADFAARTPYQLENVVEAGKMLEAYGLSTQNFLEDAGDLASAFNTDISEVARALGRINSGDFGEAFERLRDFGISRQELEGQGLEFDGSGHYVGSVDNALTAVQNIIQDKFGGTMEEQSKSANGLFSTIIDNVKEFGREAGTKAFEKVKVQLEDILNKINELKENGTFQEWAKQVGDTVATTVDFLIKLGKGIYNIGKFIKDNKGILTFFTVFLSTSLAILHRHLIVETIVGVYKKWIATSKLVTVAQTTLNAVMIANPIGLVITVVAGLIAALITLYKTNDTARYYIQQAWSVMKQIFIGGVDVILRALETFTQWIPAIGDKITEARKKMDAAFRAEHYKREMRKMQHESGVTTQKIETDELKKEKAYLRSNKKNAEYTKNANKEVVDSHKDATSKIKNTVDDRVDYIKDAADSWLDTEQAKLDRERDILEEAYQNVRDNLNKELQVIDENESKTTKAIKDSYREKIEKLKDKKDEKLDIIEEEKDAAIEALREEEEAEIESLDKRIAKVREYYDERMKSVDDVANSKIKELQKQLDEIDKSNQTNTDEEFFKAKNDELAKLQAEYEKYAIATSKQGQEKSQSLLDQINNIKSEMAKKEQEIAIRNQKESINDQIDLIKEQANEEKERLKARREAKLEELEIERKEIKEHYEEELSDLKDKYKRELDETKDHYESLVAKKEKQRDNILKVIENIYKNQKDNLNNRLKSLDDYYNQERMRLSQEEYVIKEHHAQMEASAEDFAKNYKNIMKMSQEDVIDLLQSKKNDYYESGQTLVEEFIDGINSKKRALEEKVEEISKIVSDYMELHSPAKKGPLSRLDKFWKPFDKTLFKGLNTSNITKGLDSMLNLSPNLAGVGGVIGLNQKPIVIEVPVIMDGREVARVTAPYTSKELNNEVVNKRRSTGRKGSR